MTEEKNYKQAMDALAENIQLTKEIAEIREENKKLNERTERAESWQVFYYKREEERKQKEEIFKEKIDKFKKEEEELKTKIKNYKDDVQTELENKIIIEAMTAIFKALEYYIDEDLIEQIFPDWECFAQYDEYGDKIERD